MKRFVIAALAAGLWAGAAQAQQGGVYASTVPAVPAPVVANGEVQNPGGFRPAFGSRVAAATKWLSGGTSATAGEAAPLPPPTPLPGGAGYGYPVPPPPMVAGGPDGSCGPAGCGRPPRGFSWDRVKTWLCFSPSPTDIPK